LTSGPAAIADAIKDMGAMTSLDISNNQLAFSTDWMLDFKSQPLTAGDVVTYKGQEMYVTEVAKFGNEHDGNVKLACLSGIKALADGIKDNGALSSLNLATNSLYAKGTKLLAEVLKGNNVLTELNISSNLMTHGGMSGVATLADAIPDMGALVSINIENNAIPLHQVAHLHLKVLMGRLPSAAAFVAVAVLVAALAWPFLSGLSLSPSP
jgi:hypothetical protein